MRTYIRTGNKGEKVLSYDESFKKWQKSGESKTSGGVKLGIFRFIAVLLLCISTSPLYGDNSYTSADIPCTCIVQPEDTSDECSGYSSIYSSLNITAENIETKCKAIDGCKYSSGTNGGCTSGSSGTYTENGDETSCSDTDSNYPNSAAGSWNQSQCYKSINLTDNSDIKCRWYKSGTVLCATNDIESCQGTWGPNKESDGFCALNKAVISNATTQNNSTNLSDAHNESNDVYLNIRKCELFQASYLSQNSYRYVKSANDNSTSIARTVKGDAEWNGNNWDVSGCYAERNANDIIVKYGRNAEQNAYCSGVILSKQENNDNSVNNVTTIIKYNYGNYYLCTKCNAGYVVANNAYATDSDTHLACYTTGSSYDDNNGVYVCKCDPVDRGYYLSSQVQMCNYSTSLSYSSCKKTLNQLNDLINPSNKRPCGPGQTTNEGGGATSEADCHYTTQTRFCDAHGCFYLSGLGWDATNHTYNWNGATSTSSGQ